MKHKHNNNDNLINFHFHDHDEDEWDCSHECGCDGDCENCDHPPTCIEQIDPFDLLVHQIAALRLDMLYHNAYELGLMTKEDYIDMLGHSLAEYHVDEEGE